MKWVDNPFSPNNPDRPKEMFTIEGHCRMLREALRPGDCHPVILRDNVIRLMILRHGPRNGEEIHRILTGLYLLKGEATLVEDTQFYLAQIEAYELLRLHLKLGTIQESAQPLERSKE